MADVTIKMGVDRPGSEVNRVLRILEVVGGSDAPEDSPFVFAAYETDFSDSAIGLLSGMSVVLNYTGADGEEKAFAGHILQAFERYTEEDGKPACQIAISPIGRKLIRLVLGQRDRESDEEERSRFVQQMAEELGLS